MSEDRDQLKKQLFGKGEEFLSLYRKVEQFTREILQDNEKLRFRIALLEQENKGLKDRLSVEHEEDLVDRVHRLETEKEELFERYKEVEKENIDFAKRYVEIEEENNNLANLYVASYQLHSTLDFKEVLQIVKEIIINLVGAERFAIFLLDHKKRELAAMAAEGINTDDLATVKLGSGVIGQSLMEGEGVYVSSKVEEGTRDMSDPLVSIPLKIKEEPFGAIVIFELLEQKKEFTTLDVELFNLLGGHAATAIFASKLYSESTRKLSTIQGFLELLKPE